MHSSCCSSGPLQRQVPAGRWQVAPGTDRKCRKPEKIPVTCSKPHSVPTATTRSPWSARQVLTATSTPRLESKIIIACARPLHLRLPLRRRLSRPPSSCKRPLQISASCFFSSNLFPTSSSPLPHQLNFILISSTTDRARSAIRLS